eukprot:13612326-Ditylum_brightwellii.AAC.1
MAYVGCTQDTFKARMTQHYTDVTRLTSMTTPKLAKDDKRRSNTLLNILLLTSQEMQLLNN